MKHYNITTSRPEVTSDWQKVQRKIDECPAAGSGLHSGLCTVANALRHYVDVDRGFEILRSLAIERGRGERRAVQEARELRKKWSGPRPVGDNRAYQPQAPTPKRNVAFIRQIVAGGQTSCYDLWESSPVKFDEDDASASEYALGQLFGKNEFVFISNDLYSGCACTVSQMGFLDNPSQYSFVIPNPLKKMRVRDEKTGKALLPRWLVVEFDIASWDATARHLRLGRRLYPTGPRPSISHLSTMRKLS